MMVAMVMPMMMMTVGIIHPILIWITLFGICNNGGQWCGPLGDLVHDWSSNPHHCLRHRFRQFHDSSGDGFGKVCNLRGSTFGKCQDLGGNRIDSAGEWFDQGGCMCHHCVNGGFDNVDKLSKHTSQECGRFLHNFSVWMDHLDTGCFRMNHWNVHLRRFMQAWFMVNYNGFLRSYHFVDGFLVHWFYNRFDKLFVNQLFVDQCANFFMNCPC